MKTMMIGLTALSCALVVRGETFRMDRKGETTVEVTKASGEYRVTCTFKPQTKFDQAVNAKFNDAKGDSLCKKGLARYLKVGTNETLAVSGQYAAAPVATVGDRLCYSFGVPVAGCEVLKVVPKPKPAPIAQAPALPAPVAAATMTAATNAVQTAEPKGAIAESPKVSCAATNAVQTAEPKSPAAVEEPKSPATGEEPKEPPKTAHVTKSTSYLCVTEYREVNGERTTVSRREYQGRNFKSPKEFDRFCRQEFVRIRALGEANLRAVREFGK